MNKETNKELDKFAEKVTIRKMKTKHCPYCNSKKLRYTINIFEPRISGKRYTGEVICGDCKRIFDEKKIKIRNWKELI